MGDPGGADGGQDVVDGGQDVVDGGDEAVDEPAGVIR